MNVSDRFRIAKCLVATLTWLLLVALLNANVIHSVYRHDLLNVAYLALYPNSTEPGYCWRRNGQAALDPIDRQMSPLVIYCRL